MELIKGKWYQIDSGSNMYFKYLKTLDRKIYYTENIIWNKYQVKKDYIGDGWVFREVEISEISSFLPENHIDKQLKPEDFIGKWVTCRSWTENSYAFIKEIVKRGDNFYLGYFEKNKNFSTNAKSTVDYWLIYNLSDLTIVSEAEVAKKAIEYGHDLRELGLHQFISISKTIKKEDLYNTKIWIGNNESLNKKIQERLFELGFYWYYSAKLLELNCYAIFLNSEKDLSKISDDDFKYFKNHKFKEITLSDLGIKETNNELIEESIQIIPIIKKSNINIPNIILTNNKLTI